MTAPTNPPANDPANDRASDLASDLEAADTRSQGGSVHFDVRDSTPNSGGPQGAAGDMGVSSERTGPDASDGVGHGITGTGTTGDARTRTDGAFDSSPHQWDATDVAVGGGRQGGRTAVSARNDREDELAYVEGADSETQQGPVLTEGDQGVDRTVGGEPNSMPLGGDKAHGTGRDGPL